MVKRKITKILLISFMAFSFAMTDLTLMPLKNIANAQSPEQIEATLQNEIQQATENQITTQVIDQVERLGLTPDQLTGLELNLSNLSDINQIEQFGLNTNIQNQAANLGISANQIQAIVNLQNDIQNIDIAGIGSRIQNLSTAEITDVIQQLNVGTADEQILQEIQEIIDNNGLDQLSNLSLDQLASFDFEQLANPSLDQLAGISLDQLGNFTDLNLDEVADLTDLSPEQVADLNLNQLANFTGLDIDQLADLTGLDLDQFAQIAIDFSAIDDIRALLQDIENFNLVKNLSPQSIIDFGLDQFADPNFLANLDLGNIQNLLPALSGDATTILLSTLNLSTSLGTCIGLCQCRPCASDIEEVHTDIRNHVTEELINYRVWIVETFFVEQIQPALALMAEQLTTIGMQQVGIIGSFFDAKHQLETQRLFQTLTAQAHKDYHPSEELCEIGTGVRSLASSERRTNLTQLAFANRMMQRQLLSEDVLSGKGSTSDRESRLKQFREVYCNPSDNADGLKFLCGSGGPIEQRNRDVNYTNTIENKLTLEVDFTSTDENPISTDERNVFALSANLFGHQVLNSVVDRLLADENFIPKTLSNFYIRQRAVAAKRSVAQNSFAAITAMRAVGNGENAPFLKAVIKELGVGEDLIDGYIGKNPSYFAQMEILTKKMYQNPKFYADLYDKPVNIERKGAALQAIGIMQDRDIYNSLIRSEAVLATLLETLIQKEHDRISRDLEKVEDQDEVITIK